MLDFNKYNYTQFGYPLLGECHTCREELNSSCVLNVPAYYKQGSGPKVMLIGQDPTIRNENVKVECVLMLNKPTNQLYRWLLSMLGEDNYREATIYATNAIKCTLESVPNKKAGGDKILRDHFNNCKNYLTLEVKKFKPDLVIAFGEPCHKLITEEFKISDNDDSYEKMKIAFNGLLKEVKYDEDNKFIYTPCLHIQTYRVAEAYGDKVKDFKNTILTFMKDYKG
jgi:uracil-DNA glycosylase